MRGRGRDARQGERDGEHECFDTHDERAGDDLARVGACDTDAGGARCRGSNLVFVCIDKNPMSIENGGARALCCCDDLSAQTRFKIAHELVSIEVFADEDEFA